VLVVERAKPADVGVTVGQVFLGKYRVDAILGSGAMGVVAECMHLGLNERCAIKMLRQDVLGDVDAVSRFVREAQAAVKLKSEYVAKIHDVGELENGVPYMEMEYLEGYDLGQLLEQRGRLQVPWACELMLQTCDALAEAHSLGIVHRDVKPTNLFVTWRPDGSSLLKVLDFGISKSPAGTDMQLTQTQSLLGTPAYMSPEQMRSAHLVDGRTDIWSLGTVLYELVEGRRPFEAESFSEMCVKVAVDPPGPAQHAPPALQHVMLRCLEKSPDQRYPTMADLARDLVPFVKDQHQATVMAERMGRTLRRSQSELGLDHSGVTRAPQPIMHPHGSARAASSPLPSLDGATVRVVSRRRWPLAIVGVLLGGAIVTAVVVSKSSHDEPPQHVEPAPELEASPKPAPAPEPVQVPLQVDPTAGGASEGTSVKAAIDASTAKRPSTSGAGTSKTRRTTERRGSATGTGRGTGSGSSTECDPFNAMHKC
jgi:serine/threonine-protein kinase